MKQVNHRGLSCEVSKFGQTATTSWNKVAVIEANSATNSTLSVPELISNNLY